MNNNNIKHSLLYRMKIKSFLAKPYAAYVKKKIKKDAANAEQDQLDIMQIILLIHAIFQLLHLIQQY